jgi:hypothetical protein
VARCRVLITTLLRSAEHGDGRNSAAASRAATLFRNRAG